MKLQFRERENRSAVSALGAVIAVLLVGILVKTDVALQLSTSLIRACGDMEYHMSKQLSNLAATIASSCATLLGAVKRPSRMTDRDGRYRPEMYYMRGPGPKWRAKNARVSDQSFGQK
jgi:hypothetical protein